MAIEYVNIGSDVRRKSIDSKGRCCGCKPTEYKRKGISHCFKCKAEFSLFSGRQVSSTFWTVDGERAQRRSFKPA